MLKSTEVINCQKVDRLKILNGTVLYIIQDNSHLVSNEMILFYEAGCGGKSCLKKQFNMTELSWQQHVILVEGSNLGGVKILEYNNNIEHRAGTYVKGLIERYANYCTWGIMHDLLWTRRDISCKIYGTQDRGSTRMEGCKGGGQFSKLEIVRDIEERPDYRLKVLDDFRDGSERVVNFLKVNLKPSPSTYSHPVAIQATCLFFKTVHSNLPTPSNL